MKKLISFIIFLLSFCTYHAAIGQDSLPFNKAFFGKGKVMSIAMHKIISRYDMLVIPKTDSNATANY